MQIMAAAPTQWVIRTTRSCGFRTLGAAVCMAAFRDDEAKGRKVLFFKKKQQETFD
jgi:hypothetical protein